MRARVVSSLLLLLALASPAFAAGWQAEGRPSLDRLLPEIRRHTPGTFYDAEGPFSDADGLARYRIKWMTPEGRIIWFEVDARNGQILGMVTGTLPGPSGRRGQGPEGYPPPYPPGDRFDSDRYDNNSDHYGNYDRPGYDRGQGGRDWGNDRGGRDRDGGNWDRGRGDSGRGHDR
ncbi:MAG: hypothetical protein ABSD21_07745 [Rhizomicrobium sp.]|jgi:hypothetical protein